MKLIYAPGANFGDALNPYIWEKLLPGILDNNEDTAFVGFGTILNNTYLPKWTSKARQRVIFSSGVGYGNGKGVPSLNDSDKIYCLRGPLSAQKLGMPKELAITDGAVLIRRLFKTNIPKAYKFSYMPHHLQASDFWSSVCDRLDFGYIDPRWSIEKILLSLAETEVLLTEALHGAIVADALRIPWIPIVTHSSILEFKWQDWCQSINLEYEPNVIHKIHCVSDVRTKDNVVDLATARYVHHLERQKVASINNSRSHSSQLGVLEPVDLDEDWVKQNDAVSQLGRIALTVKPSLSSDRQIENITVKLEEKIEEVKYESKR